MGILEIERRGAIAVDDVTVDVRATSAVGVVPEPSQWALLITGFGLAGSALRQTRRQRSLAR